MQLSQVNHAGARMDTHPTPVAYKVVDWHLPGQMDVVATRTIEDGEIIINEAAHVWQPIAEKTFPSSQWGLVQQLLHQAKLRRELYSWQLFGDSKFPFDDEDRAVAQSLSSRYNTSVRNVISLYQIVAANNIGGIDRSGNICGYGVFKVLSRVNHACIPNSAIGIDSDSERPTPLLIALRKIAPGESLTWRYIPFASSPNGIDPLEDYHARNWQLVDQLDFACQCDLCLQQMPTELRGKDVLQIYKKLISEEAERLCKEFLASGSKTPPPTQLPPVDSPWKK